MGAVVDGDREDRGSVVVEHGNGGCGQHGDDSAARVSHAELDRDPLVGVDGADVSVAGNLGSSGWC